MRLQELVEDRQKIIPLATTESDYMVYDEGGGPPIMSVKEHIKKLCQPWLAAAKGKLIFRGTNDVATSVNDAGEEVQYLAYIKGVRDDRRPLDSSPVQHAAFNAAIKSVGGIANRSNSTFVNSANSLASGFGSYTWTVFPVGEFSYTWSPYYRDWTNEFHPFILQRMVTLTPTELEEIEEEANAAVASELNQYLEKMTSWKDEYDKKDMLAILEKNKAERVQRLIAKRIHEVKKARFEHAHSNPNIYDAEKMAEHIYVDRGLSDALASNYEIMIRCAKMIYVVPNYYHKIFPQG